MYNRFKYLLSFTSLYAIHEIMIDNAIFLSCLWLILIAIDLGLVPFLKIRAEWKQMF